MIEGLELTLQQRVGYVSEGGGRKSNNKGYYVILRQYEVIFFYPI